MSRAIAAALVVGLGCGGGPAAIVERDGEVVLEVSVELAETEAERQQGLRGRPPLAADEGLVLVLPEPLDVCIVNDGVELAIDALFAGEDGLVRAIERGIPAGDPSARCHGSTRRILEVAAGVADRVAIGDRLVVVE